MRRCGRCGRWVGVERCAPRLLDAAVGHWGYTFRIRKGHGCKQISSANPVAVDILFGATVPRFGVQHRRLERLQHDVQRGGEEAEDGVDARHQVVHSEDEREAEPPPAHRGLNTGRAAGEVDEGEEQQQVGEEERGDGGHRGAT